MSGDDATALDPARIRFVLVGPRSPGNVGATARALKNLGFERLVVVAPRCDLEDEDAARMAVSAADVLRGARIESDLDRALEGAGIVIGASRRTGKQRRPHWRLDRFVTEVAWPAGAEIAAVFGREDHGLSDAELDRCTHLVHLPGSASYPSFNLAQSVLLMAYELRRAALPAPAPALAPPAPHADREELFAHLERAFLRIGYVHPETAESILRRWRRLLGRASISGEEVKLLRGLARQTEWVADRAGLGPAAPRDESE